MDHTLTFKIDIVIMTPVWRRTLAGFVIIVSVPASGEASGIRSQMFQWEEPSV